MEKSPLKVAWLSFFPVEWLSGIPDEIASVPKQHPATWQRVLLQEFVREPDLELHIFSLRKHYRRNLSFRWVPTVSSGREAEQASFEGNSFPWEWHGGERTCEQPKGVVFHCLRVPGGMRTASFFWWDTLLIRTYLRRIQPDLVHAWGSERGAALVASRLPYPYLVTMQGLLQWYLEHVDLGGVVRFEARLENMALRRARIVTTESSFAVSWLEEHYPTLEVLQAEHAPNWMFHRLERRPDTKPIQFLCVAPISEIKGSDLLVKALDRLRNEFDFRLTMVGSPQPGFLDKIRAETSSAIWDRITRRQGLTPREIADELARATMVLFPTRVDTSPNSVKEAVVAGVPVVGCSIGGVRDYVLPGLNGFTFRTGNLGDFLQKTREALAHPLFREGKVELGALVNLREHLSPKVMRERFRTAYDRVLTH